MFHIDNIAPCDSVTNMTFFSLVGQLPAQKQIFSKPRNDLLMVDGTYYLKRTGNVLGLLGAMQAHHGSEIGTPKLMPYVYLPFPISHQIYLSSMLHITHPWSYAIVHCTRLFTQGPDMKQAQGGNFDMKHCLHGRV